MKTPRRLVAILVFDEVEVLDFCGPFEVFSVAGNRREPAPFSVITVAERSGPVVARNGLSVNPHYTFVDAPPVSILLVPGGMGTRREMNNPKLIDWVRERAASAELVLSVCTGALILGKAGLLDGIDATTHHGSFDLLRQTAPKTRVIEGKRFVDTGRIVTSGGIAAGIDMALHVVNRLEGMDLTMETAVHMEYPYPTGG